MTSSQEPTLNPRVQQTLWLAIAVVIVVLAVAAFFIVTPKPQVTNNHAASVSEVVEASDRVERALDGVWVEPGEENHVPVAIMIENLGEARPQSGLSAANLVFEAPVEAGIPPGRVTDRETQRLA